MAANEIREGDIGTVLRLTVMDGADVQDISTATTTQMIFVKPSQTKVTKDAEFTTDGTDGQIQYVTVEGDLDETGVWQRQAYIVMPGWTGHSDKSKVEVHSNL